METRCEHVNMHPAIPICVFVKATRPGEVKTRLIPFVGPDAAAILARSFFDDVWRTVSSLTWADPIVACTEPIAFADGRTVRVQSNGDLGRRMEAMLRSALHGNMGAFVIGADLPGLPAEILNRAYAALATSDAVLGPSDDGGFYLLGLRHCLEGLLSGIRWSDNDTFLQTFTRLRQANMSVAVLERWWDVDTPEDLKHLQTLIDTGQVTAPFTKSALDRLRAPMPE